MMARLPIIFIAGGSASGKTTLAKAVLAAREGGVILSQDSFYYCKTERLKAETWPLNFDIPEAVDFKALVKAAIDLSSGKATRIPHYDFTTSSRQGILTIAPPENYLILEGTMILHNADCQNLPGLRVFVNAAQDLRKERRIKRDVEERARTVESAMTALTTAVFPSHDQYVQPSMAHADIVFEAEEIIGNLEPAIEFIFAQLAQKTPLV